MAEGREGDWECSGCKNRNYAFRSYCNRCRQPRLLVDTNTPSDYKWLPRVGDWICTGCTNNNYASRDKCKKCGHTKEAAAILAAVMPGTTSLPGYYSPRGQGGGLMMGNQLPLAMHAANWGVADNRHGGGGGGGGMNGIHNAGLIVPYANEVPKGFRSGDWICGCGFHNYQSRTQCKKCNASPPALGIKRLVPEEFVHDWDNKRLNLGHAIGHQQSYPGFEQVIGARGNPIAAPYGPYHDVNPLLAPNLQVPMALPQHAPALTLLGKGAKQWRNGDWMCSNCDNHNYASRLSCNRCKTEREVGSSLQN